MEEVQNNKMENKKNYIMVRLDTVTKDLIKKRSEGFGFRDMSKYTREALLCYNPSMISEQEKATLIAISRT